MLALLAALFWWVWLPRYRPGLRAGERYGIDVSAHQGRIDWRKVRADHIAFAYIKASEGGDFVDRRFAANWAAAAQAGVQRGAYHFFTLCTPGAVQAEHFLKTVPQTDGVLPPAVDLELAGNCSRRPRATDLQRELAEFLQVIEGRTGTPTLLYVSRDFDDRYHVLRTFPRPRWHQRFVRRPSGRWRVWQVQGYAHVDGIAGRVDLDVMRF